MRYIDAKISNVSITDDEQINLNFINQVVDIGLISKTYGLYQTLC